MRGIIIRNSRLPGLLSLFFPIAAITIGPFIFISKGKANALLINHERIHVKQGAGLLFIGFWILYLLFWVFALLKYRDPYKAYQRIPFEREAYRNDFNLRYKPGFFSWVRYLV